nr:MAG TPA: hypothetical protein [Caudoviricetes sp.]
MVDQQIVDQQQFIHNFRDNNFWDNSNNNNMRIHLFLRCMVGDREGGAI